jgi:hypothetical protein
LSARPADPQEEARGTHWSAGLIPVVTMGLHALIEISLGMRRV